MHEITRRIILCPHVAEDLENQVEYLDINASPEVGDRYLSAANDTFRNLAEMPGVGSVRETLNPRLTGLRMWHVADFPKYLIFYRFNDEALEIIRVLHGAQDITQILIEEG